MKPVASEPMSSSYTSATSATATGDLDPARAYIFMWLAWAIAATSFAVLGGYSHLPPQIVPVTILGPFAIFCVLLASRPAVRRAVDGLPLRWLVAYHIIRAPIGLEFLRVHAEGGLPAAFAWTAGIGDIIAGGLAVVALSWVGKPAPWARRALLAWNTIALFDILLVIVTAQRLILIEGDQTMFATMSQAPYSLIPVLVVPMVLMTHVVIYRQLRAKPGQ